MPWLAWLGNGYDVLSRARAIMKSRKRRLRIGFTTGTAAAAAAKAAVLFIGGRQGIREVDTPLPDNTRMRIPISLLKAQKDGASALVIKDGGDDPDATHRAHIWCRVRIDPSGPKGNVTITGGEGVGRVTKPGLPVEVGQYAINPAPKQQITRAVREGLVEAGIEGSVTVTVEVPGGEEIAQKTLNPRLGIVGGISILGTRGTVVAFSTEAYKDTITLAMNVARAQGLGTIVLTTGGRSERFLRGLRPDIPPVAFVQVADFFSFSVQEAVRKGFSHIIYSCFFGKLVKMALGHGYTHARSSVLDLKRLSQWAREEGIQDEAAGKVASSNTAREALGVILGQECADRVLARVLKEALARAREFAGPGPRLTYFLFSTDGKLLAHKTDPQSTIGYGAKKRR